MARTTRNIYYPNDYSEDADIPADMRQLAESVDEAIENAIEEASYDDAEIVAQISNIEAEQTTQNTNIANNTQNIQANTTAIQGLQSKITSSNKLASDLVDDTNQTNKFVTASEKTTWGAKYDKPAGGIPKTDLASDVQTSLGKADTAIQDISGKQDLLTAGANIQISNNVVSATDTTYSNATDETAGLMSATDKSKLDGIEAEANKTIADSELDDTSENPVQNKVIYASQEVQNTKIETLEADVEDLRNASMKVSGSGSNFKLSNTAKARFLELLGGGNTEQEGTPAPDNECPIYNVTGNVNNKIQNKNFFDINTMVSSSSFINYNSNQPLNYEYLVTPNVDYKTLIIPVKPNTTYTTSCKVEGTRHIIAGFENRPTNQMAIDQLITTTTISTTFTTNSNINYICAFVCNDGVLPSEFQLEPGLTATNFVEHQEQNLPLTLGDTKLCKKPNTDYKDYYFKNIKGSKYYNSELTENKWYLHEKIGKVVLNGSENYTLLDAPNTFANGFKLMFTGVETVDLLSNYFISDTVSNLWNQAKEGIGYSLTGGYFAIYINKTLVTTVEEFKTWLSTHNTEVYYVLQNPTNTLVTDTTLEAQLEAMLKAYSYADETNILSESNELGMIIDVTAIANTNKIINGTDFSTMSLCCIGDSLTHPSDNGQNALNPMYPEIVKNILGLGSFTNSGLSGSTVANNSASPATPMSNDTRMASYPNADIIIIGGGYNDWGNSIPLGSIGSNDETTFYGGYKKLLNYLITNNPSSTIIVMITPMANSVPTTPNSNNNTKLDFINAMYEIARYFNVPLLDMNEKGSLGFYNKSTWTNDGLHFKQQYVNNIYAPRIAKFIKNNL